MEPAEQPKTMPEKPKEVRYNRPLNKGKAVCLTQKELAGEKEWIFLINRTEHPRLAERVRCLCVGCSVTWGPPCQALVTRLPANRRRWTENSRATQKSSNNTSNTVHNRFYVVR